MEASMTYMARPAAFHAATPCPPAARTPPRRRGFWRAVVDAIALAHQRDTEREIARYVARRGKLTDSIEREIAEKMMGPWRC
jgi:hypothetical protein